MLSSRINSIKFHSPKILTLPSIQFKLGIGVKFVQGGLLQFSWCDNCFTVPKDLFHTDPTFFDSQNHFLNLLSYSDDLEAVITINSDRELAIFCFDWDYLNKVNNFRQSLSFPIVEATIGVKKGASQEHHRKEQLHQRFCMILRINFKILWNHLNR